MLQIMDAMQPAGEQDRAGWQGVSMPVLYENRNHGGWLILSRTGGNRYRSGCMGGWQPQPS